MLKYFYSTLSLIILLVSNSYAQSFQKTEQGIKTVIKGTNIEIKFYTPEIVRIIKVPEQDTFSKESLSVILSPGKTKFTVRKADNFVILTTDKLQITLQLISGEIAFSTKDATPLLKEKWTGSEFKPLTDKGNNVYNISQSYSLDKKEAIYGLGILQRGRMSQRNQEIRMVQGNTEDYIPFFQSEKGYGLFWDNYSPTRFSDSTEGTSFSSEAGKGIDYYFMYGGNPDGVIACMRNLTGQVPMFPLWTYGYWQSKERYKSQDELLSVVKKYRELGVPLDGIIQDWQYWGNNYLWNAMEFLNTEFYNPEKMVNDVHDMNAHIIISIWSSFGPHTKPYRELDKINALYNFRTWPESGVDKWPPNMDYPSGVRVYDAFNPEARDIYWKYLKEGLYSVGIDGWWMDSTEPDNFDNKPSDTYLGSYQTVRNAFPLVSVGGVYEHQRALSSDKRVFILTRSAFAGQQRFGANTWSGDVFSSWEALSNQIPAGLNFSMCGIPYWNSDIGGFFLSKFKNKLNDPDYRELYTRWIQFGTFCPMMRSHGADAPREIYQFGQKGEKIYDAIEKYINLRYQLLPYIYSASWEVTANQSSMMRALVMDFSQDEKVLDMNDEYMFGRSILVAPVTTPMYSKDMKEDFSVVKSRVVYLPKGSDWLDFWTGEKFSGGSNVVKETPIDIIPLYVKAGSILPTGPKVQFATEKKWNQLEIRLYPGADGKFTLYEDENDNYNYEKGDYSTIVFTWDDSKNTLTISSRTGSFANMLQERTFRIVKVSADSGLGTNTPTQLKEIKYNGKKITVKI